MTTTTPPTRPLDALLRPASVAVIGASNDPTRIGGRPIRYLRAAGFAGRVYPVNPRHAEVQGLPAFPRIEDVPEAVDLAIVAVPAPSVVDTVQACAARGVQVVVIYSAGFAEMGAEGRRLQQRLREIATETGLRIVGPNCLGVYNSELGFFATFSTTLEDGFPAPGGVALVSQSGAYGSHLSLLARKRNIDIRYWVTTGNEADVSVPEVLGWLAEQDDVSVIMAHAEGITDREALVRALGTARARRKPVVFQKVGVTEVGAQAAQSHTASLAGADAIYEAAFRQFGAYRARDTDEMLDIAYAASFGVFPKSPRVALVSISGGVGVQMADAAVGFGLDVAPLERIGANPVEGGAPLRLATQSGRHHRPGVQPGRAHRRQPRHRVRGGAARRGGRLLHVRGRGRRHDRADPASDPCRPRAAARVRAGAVHRRAAGCRPAVRGGRLPRLRGPHPRGTGGRGAAPFQSDLRGARRCTGDRAARGEPARRSSLRTAGETPACGRRGAGRPRRARTQSRRGRAHRRGVRRTGGGQALRTRRPPQGRGRRRGARRVHPGRGAVGPARP